VSAATVLDQFLDPLSRCLDTESARRVLALGVSASVQERVDTLAERANEGLLSDGVGDADTRPNQSPELL